MSLPTRVCLAIALAWAGGFGLPGPPGWELLGLVVAIGLGWWVTPANGAGWGGEDRATRAVGALGLALMLALFGRTLGRVIIASPAALLSVPVVGLGLLLAWRFGSRSWAALVIVGLGFTAAGLGGQFESRGPQARGAVFSGPVLGIHPRQAVAVQIDGHGPHDIIVDDFVDPPGGQGYDPSTWAAWLEAELHAIAERHYADGPVRARVAFAMAEVEARESVVPPAERELHDSLLGVELRSGTIGEGSRVEFVCPGQPHGPTDEPSDHSPLPRSCPRKYVIDGSTGLGLSPRWPGYTELRGRDRARLARVFGWPTGDAQADRRLLAIESGAWLLMLVVAAWLAVVLATAKRKPPTTSPEQPAKIGLTVSALILAGLALAAVLAPASTASALHGGPTLLAILLVLLPTRRQPTEPAALPCALLLGLLAASPLAGHGDAVELLARVRDQLVDLGLAWSLAAAFAGAAAVLVLAVGAGICVTAMIDRASVASEGREGRHTRAALVALALALALAVGLALRKPGDDLALLQSAAALLLLATLRLGSRAKQRALALVCALLAAAPILDGDVHTPLALALVALGSLLCLVIGLVQPPSPR